MNLTDDEQHLNLLSIFHYVVGGMSALCSCFPFFYIAIGIVMLSGALEGHGKNPPPRALGWIFVVFPAMLILAGWALSICIIVAGRMLAQRRAWTYCIVIAALECLMMPLGTVLGVFTIFVLMRESVQKLFRTGGHGALPTPMGPPS